MNRPESQRRGAISEMSKERREYAAADERRRQFEAATRDKEANQRARKEFAEISQRQLNRAQAPVDLDDATPLQRQRQKLIAQPWLPDEHEAQPSDARRGKPTAADSEVISISGAPPASGAGPRRAKTTEQVQSESASMPKLPNEPAQASGKLTPDTQSNPPKSGSDAKPRAEMNRAPVAAPDAAARPAEPPSARAAAATRGLFVVVEQRAEPAPPRGGGRAIEYLPEGYHGWAPGGWALGDYLPSQRNNLILCAMVAIISIVLIRWFWDSPQVQFYRGNLALGGSGSVSNSTNLAAPADTDGAHVVVGGPTIAADMVDAVLTKYGSPAAGTGRIWVELGQRYGIDPAYALAFFIHESGAGTNPGWAGMKPGGDSTHNIGNIICAGYSTCYGRFRDYTSWEAGIEDWYKLISEEYVNSRGAKTVEQIIPIYAPSSDNNDPAGYIQSVLDLVKDWRQGVVQ